MSIEKSIASALEPVVDTILDLEQKIELVSKQVPVSGKDGVDGKDADPDEVARILVDKYSDALKGPKGDSAEAPATPTAEEVAAALLVGFPASLRGEKGEGGRDGKDAEPEAVAKVLVDKFAHMLKGAKGDKGVAGDKGDQGDVGPRGPKGADADTIEVAKTIVKDYGDLIRGRRGLKGEKGDSGNDADPHEVAKNLAQHYADVIRGLRGEKGDSGKPGVDGKHGLDGKDGRDGIGYNVKFWKKGIHREGEIVQHDFGRVSIALKDTNEEPGKSSDWERIGTGGFRWCGVKSANSKYEDGDIYIDDGTSFIVVDGKSKMLAKRGEKGAKGDKGDAGEQGDDAAEVIEVQFELDGFVFVKSDGTMLEAKADWFTKTYQKMVDTLFEVQKRLAFIDEIQQERVEIKQPITQYRGAYNRNRSYARGDTVTFNKGFWLCLANTDSPDLNNASWVKLAGTGGGGGDGGGMRSPYTLVKDITDLPAAGLFDGQTVYDRETGDTYTWDALKNEWKTETPVTLKPLKTDADPVTGLSKADLRLTEELGHAELKYWTGTEWKILFGEDEIREWIAAASLFQGTVADVAAAGAIDLATLPDPADNNQAHYWTWTGPANFAVTATTPKIGADLDGTLLQVGDWIQSNGKNWLHIGSDLLSKVRGDKLYSFNTWTAGAWESGSVVVYENSVWSATRDILPADVAPEDGGAWRRVGNFDRNLLGWTSTIGYLNHDIVVYKNSLWAATKTIAVGGTEPAAGNADWFLIGNFGQQIYSQTATPVGEQIGALWFDTADSEIYLRDAMRWRKLAEDATLDKLRAEIKSLESIIKNIANPKIIVDRTLVLPNGSPLIDFRSEPTAFFGGWTVGPGGGETNGTAIFVVRSNLDVGEDPVMTTITPSPDSYGFNFWANLRAAPSNAMPVGSKFKRMDSVADVDAFKAIMTRQGVPATGFAGVTLEMFLGAYKYAYFLEFKGLRWVWGDPEGFWFVMSRRPDDQITNAFSIG